MKRAILNKNAKDKGVKEMSKEKQYVFSARTTEEGLKALNEVKSCFKIGWDELVIDAVSAHYQLDKAMMTLPRKEKPTNEVRPAEQPPTSEPATEQPATVEQEHPTEGKRPSKKKGGKKKASEPGAAA